MFVRHHQSPLELSPADRSQRQWHQGHVSSILKRPLYSEFYTVKTLTCFFFGNIKAFCKPSTRLQKQMVSRDAPQKTKVRAVLYSLCKAPYRGRETDGEDGDVPSAWRTVAPVAVGSQVCNVLLELTHPPPAVNNAGKGKFLEKSHSSFRKM